MGLRLTDEDFKLIAKFLSKLQARLAGSEIDRQSYWVTVDEMTQMVRRGDRQIISYMRAVVAAAD
jgi:hypothetical protein